MTILVWWTLCSFPNNTNNFVHYFILFSKSGHNFFLLKQGDFLYANRILFMWSAGILLRHNKLQFVVSIGFSMLAPPHKVSLKFMAIKLAKHFLWKNSQIYGFMNLWGPTPLPSYIWQKIYHLNYVFLDWGHNPLFEITSVNVLPTLMILKERVLYK